MASLEERSAQFASELQTTLDGVLPGERTIVSQRAAGTHRYLVQPLGDSAAERRIPLYVAEEHLADLGVILHLDLDRTRTHLKTVRSDVVILSVLDRTPLLRIEYRHDMRSEPIAHWQVHAERGAFSHLLARAHEHRPRRVSRPHDLSSLHLPVGGERFRPCVEDVLQFLVVDCGVDHHEGWQEIVDRGRESWRRRQLGSAVRDVPTEAVRVLRELGWSVTPPEPPAIEENLSALITW